MIFEETAGRHGGKRRRVLVGINSSFDLIRLLSFGMIPSYRQ